MKLMRFAVGETQRLALVLGELIFDLADLADLLALALPHTMEDAMALPPAFWRDILPKLEAKPALALDGRQLRFAPCVPAPQKIVGVGLNYGMHAAESGMEPPAEPVIFGIFGNALAAHGQTIRLPAWGSQIDYEAELVLVVGKRAENVSEAEAMDHVFGYTVGNDLSIRDAQFRTGQWLIGKTADGFAPVGPWIVPRDQVDVGNLEITCKVNGQLRQQGNTRDMLFSPACIVAHVSQYMSLQPGDLIFTGTPAGVAMGYPQGQQPWLRSGDQVVCEIEGIGRLVNYIE